jgi:hypothetical protein
MADPTNPANTPVPPSFKNPDTVPFIYFDVAPTFGTMAGAIQIELAARILLPTPDGGAKAEFVTTAHLRCSPAAAGSLRKAIEKCLELVKQLQEKGQASEAAAVGKLN